MEGAEAVPAHRAATEMTFPRVACTTLTALLMEVVEGPVLNEIRASQQPGPNRVDGWPQWRGANRDGAATFSVPKTWPEKLTLKWKVDVGTGYAAPITVGDRVYAFS